MRTAILGAAPEADLAGLDPAEDLGAALDLDSPDFLAVLENIAELTRLVVPEGGYAEVDAVSGLVGHVVAHATRDPARA